MAALLHLSVKRRRSPEGFLDILTKEYNHYKDDSHEVGTELKEMIEIWLVEEELLSNPPQASDSINLLNIADTIMNRVCEISGHVWIEFMEGANGASIYGAAAQQRDNINAYVAEFIPTFEALVDLIFEIFESAQGGEIYWGNVTNEHLLKLFGHLLDDSTADKKSLPPNSRPPAGVLTGGPNLISPAQLREQSEFWFNDRSNPYMTPAWQVDDSLAVITSFIQESLGLNYSFTPEYYSDAENCVTWAALALDNLVPQDDWLEVVRQQCGIDPNTLHKGGCKDPHIREQGRMSCTTKYANQADQQRKGGLIAFS